MSYPNAISDSIRRISRRTPRSKLVGFSLIEILVTVAIIGILASLAFPLVSRVTEKGNTAKALSNLKQIGVATTLFANDNDSRLPVVSTPAPENKIWILQLWPYAYPNTTYPGLSANDGPDKLIGTIFYTPNVEKNTGRVVRSFGWNQNLRTPVNPNDPVKRVTSFDVASKFCIAADVTSSSNLNERQINFRNAGKAAALFLDGHAALVEPDDVPDTNVGPFWRGVDD